MIELQSVGFQYQDRAQRSIGGNSCTAGAGEVIVIAGESGCGKSTLLRRINGLCPGFYEGIAEGKVLLAGQDVQSLRIGDVSRIAATVFQNPDNQIIANLVEDDVGFGPENLGVPTEDIWKRVDAALEAVGMTAYRLKSPNHLSGGQKQRVAIAGVMAMHPKCIVLDEPTAMLDPNGRKEVIRTITELNRSEGVTVVLITHYMEEVVGADRLIVMDGGHVIMDGTPREVFSHVEELKRLRLDVPQATELAHELRQCGVSLPESVLSMEELAEAILPLWKEN